MSIQNNPHDGFGVQQIGFPAQPAGPGEVQSDPLREPPDASAGRHPELVKDTTTASFTADVIEESRRQPVLVDFWAPWCGPCKQLTPVLERAVGEAGGSVKLVKMNIDEHPGIAGQLGIQSIPAVIAFKDGRPVDGFMGAIPESQVRDFIQRIGGDARGRSRIEEAMAAARDAAAHDDWTAAAQIYASVLQDAPDRFDVIAGLAEAVFGAGDVVNAKEILAGLPEDKDDDPAFSAIRAKIALAEQTDALGDPAELLRRLENDSQDHQARFDLAILQNARGQRDEAADNLLTIIQADRSWKEDGARTQLLQFFNAWGIGDMATLAARRKLSSLLFS